MTDPIAMLAGSLTPCTLAAVLADLDASRPDDPERQAAHDRIAAAFADQLAALEGDDAADRLQPEYPTSPAGQMKVQFP